MFFIKLLEDRLDIVKVKDPVLYLFNPKLGVSFDFALGYINKNLGIAKILLKKKS